MNIDGLLEYMEELLEEGAGVPFSGGKRMVDVEKVRDVIDELRRQLPDELRQAKAIVNDRADIIEDAHREADLLTRKAQERARVLVSEQEIVREAQKRAAEILNTAQSQAKEMRNSVTDYCDNMLHTTEEQLLRSTAEMKTLRSSLRQSGKNGGGSNA